VEKIENGELLASVEKICFPSTAAAV